MQSGREKPVAEHQKYICCERREVKGTSQAKSNVEKLPQIN